MPARPATGRSAATSTASGQFRLSDKWVFGWDGTLLTDKSYYQDYGFFKTANVTDLLKTTPDHVRSQAYLQGSGARSFFDMRAMYFYGFSVFDDQKRVAGRSSGGQSLLYVQSAGRRAAS